MEQLQEPSVIDAINLGRSLNRLNWHAEHAFLLPSGRHVSLAQRLLIRLPSMVRVLLPAAKREAVHRSLKELANNWGPPDSDDHVQDLANLQAEINTAPNEVWHFVVEQVFQEYLRAWSERFQAIESLISSNLESEQMGVAVALGRAIDQVARPPHVYRHLFWVAASEHEQQKRFEAEMKSRCRAVDFPRQLPPQDDMTANDTTQKPVDSVSPGGFEPRPTGFGVPIAVAQEPPHLEPVSTQLRALPSKRYLGELTLPEDWFEQVKARWVEVFGRDSDQLTTQPHLTTRFERCSFGAQLLNAARKAAEPSVSQRIAVHLTPQPCIIVDGAKHPVGREAARFANEVVQAEGTWITTRELKKKPGLEKLKRGDRTFQKLPPEVRILFDHVPGKGFRLREEV